MLNVCRQHSATLPVGIITEERDVVPKQVQVVNEIQIVGMAWGVEPGVQTKNVVESLRSECGDWAKDKTDLPVPF